MQYKEEVTEFKRLSPFSILLRLIETSPHLIIPAYFAMQGDWENIVFVSIILFFGIFSLIGMVLNYYYFTYQFYGNEIIIRSGVISKKQRNIPFKRIQNTNLSQNILHRIFNLYKLEFETAGDSSSEGVLNGISKKHYIEIEGLIDEYKERNKQELSSEDIEESLDEEDISEIGVGKIGKQKGQILFELDFVGLLKFGIMRFRPLLLPIVGYLYSMFQQYNPNLSENIGYWAESNLGFLFKNVNTLELVVAIILFILGAVLFSWLLDIILTVNQFFKFTLTSEGEHLKTTRGLLNKRSATIPLKKLQMMSINTNFIRRKFNYFGLSLETAGFGGKSAKGPEVAVPFTKLDRIIDLARSITDFEYPFDFKSVSRKTIRRAIFRYIVVLIPLLIILSIINNNVLFIFALLPLIYFPALLKYRYRLYSISADKIIIKQGFIFEKTSIIPIEKIQNVIVKETFFQRKLGLATLIIDTAATPRLNESSIIDIDLDSAKELMQEIVNRFNEKNNE